MSAIEPIWYGNAGHFICGQWCRFHMATRVGDYWVSTVGEYVPPGAGSSEQSESEWLAKNPLGAEIGCGRKFETMVFRCSGQDCECGCGLPLFDGSEIDSDGYNDRAAANEGHRAMVAKYVEIARQEKS